VEVKCRVIGLDGVVFEGPGGVGVFVVSLPKDWSWFGVVELVVDFLQLVLAR
jgi:hypothetical protein